MPLTQLDPDKYYFAVQCAKCNKQIAFAEAPSPNKEPRPKQRTVSNLKCPNCDHTDTTDTYAPALMRVAQGPEEQ
jgi:ribosomal protein S27E